MHLEEITIKPELAHFDSLDLLHQHVSPVQVPVLKLHCLLRHCQCVGNLEYNGPSLKPSLFKNRPPNFT